MTARRFALSPEEAQALADEIRAAREARRRIEEARTRLGLRGGYAGLLRRWEWKVFDLTTGKDLATGRALTERAMCRRRYAAYLQVLDRLAEGRAEGDLLRTRRSPIYFCATCAVNEGKEHAAWCHRQGVVGGLAEGRADS